VATRYVVRSDPPGLYLLSCGEDDRLCLTPGNRPGLIFPILTLAVLYGRWTAFSHGMWHRSGLRRRERGSANPRQQLGRATLRSTRLGRVYFPRRHHAIALRVGMDGARETDVVRSVRGFSSLGIWVRPPYEGRQAQVAPQIRLRLPAGFADRRKSGSLSD